MNWRITFFLLLTANALLNSSATSGFTFAQDNLSVGSGTLGVLIITREGMVLAADSRTTYSNGHGHDDRAVKIFKLGNAGCMVAGTVVAPPTVGTFGFNLPKEIETIAGIPQVLDSPSVYEGYLEHRLGTAIDEGIIKVLAADFFDDDQEIASVLLGGYHLVKGGQPPSKIPDRYLDEAYKIKYLSRPTPSIEGGRSVLGPFNSAYSVPVRQYYVLEVAGPGPFVIFTNGNDHLLKAILHGKQSWPILTSKDRLREVDLRSVSEDPEMKSYFELKNRGQLDSMSLAQAVKLADSLIEENIRLAGDDLGIGGQVDIATITRMEGFRWVPEHDPAIKLRQDHP